MAEILIIAADEFSAHRILEALKHPITAHFSSRVVTEEQADEPAAALLYLAVEIPIQALSPRRPLVWLTHSQDHLRGLQAIEQGFASVLSLDELSRLPLLLRKILSRAEKQQKSQAILEEQVVRRTAALEAANRELEAFAYSISHDLRAPLRSLEGFSLALLEDYGERLGEEGCLFIQRIRRATQRLGERLSVLLQLSHLSSKTIKREHVDLGALAESILLNLQNENPERRLSFSRAFQLTALCDPALMTIVLDNLLANAWKFSRDKSKAEIHFGRRENHFYIRDNGVGFSSSYATRIFSAFSRYHTEQEFEGTGIGLTTVQRIIHRHGGRVWAESIEGEGATFNFSLGSA